MIRRLFCLILGHRLAWPLDVGEREATAWDVDVKTWADAERSRARPNGAFIAASRTAVPELIAEVRRIAVENDRLRLDRERLAAWVEGFEPRTAVSMRFGPSGFERPCRSEDVAATLAALAAGIRAGGGTRRMRCRGGFGRTRGTWLT